MKIKNRNIKVFQKNIKIDNENIINLKKQHINKIYQYDNVFNFKYNEIVLSPKNIFQKQNKNIYTIYKSIGTLLENACNYYEIDKERQFYYITGKIVEYNINNNNEVFDFPGKDIPVFHGFYILSDKNIKQKYYTEKEESEYFFNIGTLTLSSPTNLVNTKTDGLCYILEYYVAPASCISQNEDGLWIPIV
jgi:hypothetical protein